MLQGNSIDAAEHLPGKETGVGLNTSVSCSSEWLMGDGRLRNLTFHDCFSRQILCGQGFAC